MSGNLLRDFFFSIDFFEDVFVFMGDTLVIVSTLHEKYFSNTSYHMYVVTVDGIS